MRFVAVKGEVQQARAMLFQKLDLLVRQRTQTINGYVATWQSSASLLRRVWLMSIGWHRHSRIPGSGLPGAVRALGGVLLGQIADFDAKIGGLEKELRAFELQDETQRCGSRGFQARKIDLGPGSRISIRRLRRQTSRIVRPDR